MCLGARHEATNGSLFNKAAPATQMLNSQMPRDVTSKVNQIAPTGKSETLSKVKSSSYKSNSETPSSSKLLSTSKATYNMKELRKDTFHEMPQNLLKQKPSSVLLTRNSSILSAQVSFKYSSIFCA